MPAAGRQAAPKRPPSGRKPRASVPTHRASSTAFAVQPTVRSLQRVSGSKWAATVLSSHSSPELGRRTYLQLANYPLINTTIPQTGLRCSRFIFGTASVFNAGNATSRRRLLDAAVAGGFTHFDTAPYYGFGMAERDLAPVLKANPSCTFTTKVGLYSPGGESQNALFIFGRKAAGRLLPALSRATVDFSVRRAQQALEGSLRRTGRETVDLYMLHEAEIDLVNTDEWLTWLQACVHDGKIRHFGLAVTAGRLEAFLKAGSPLASVAQIPDSLDGREADLLSRYGKPMQITYGYVSDARRRGSSLSAAQVLSQALARNRDGAIIVSTTQADRGGQYARILEGVAA